MTYECNIMTQEQAEDIAFNWNYDGEYSFYDMEADEEDLAEFLSPNKRGNSTYAVSKGKELVGFFSVSLYTNKKVNQ